jgi:hypothetical protein
VNKETFVNVIKCFWINACIINVNIFENCDDTDKVGIFSDTFQ